MKLFSSSNLMFGFAGLVMVGVIVMAAVKPGVPAGQYEEFAQCITESNATMYGTYQCGHCQNQKDMFGEAFEYIDYIECTDPDSGGQITECQEVGITGYPSWIFGDGTLIPGEMPLEKLAELTGCELSSEE